MTQPAAEQPRRIPLDELTSDALDQLYAELDRLRARVQDWRTSTGAGIRLVDELRAERDALAAGVPLVCSDDRHKAKVFALEMARQQAEKRAKRAEAAIERARAIHQPASDWSWKPFGCNHIGEHKAPCTTCRTCWPCPTIEALDEQQEQPPSLVPTITLLHHACGRLADVPGDVTLQPGQLSWPGHDCSTDTTA